MPTSRRGPRPSWYRRCGRFLLSAGAADFLDGDRREAGLLGDRTVLLLDHRAGGRVAIETAQHRARHLAVRSLRAVLIEDVEQHEFSSGPGFSSHFSSSCSRCGWTAVPPQKKALPEGKVPNLPEKK